VIKIEELENSKVKFYYEINYVEVGYVIVEDVIDVINIVDVKVVDEHRRKGIARELFKYIFNYYKDRELRYMLEVRKDNLPAISLYDSLGFNKIYVRNKYYKDVDAIIMEYKN